MMRCSLFIVAGAALLTAQATAVAQSADKVFICAFNEVRECKPFGDCKRVSPKDANLAPIVMLDLEKKELVSISMGDPNREELIGGIKSTDDAVYLHGQQGKEAWSAVISLKTGSMTANISVEDLGFVVFGNCAPK